MGWESDSPCTPIHTPGRKAGLLEGAVAGSWSLGIVEQSQHEGCCWLQRNRARGCEGGDWGEKRMWRKARQPRKQGDTAESRFGGGAITTASLSTHRVCFGSWNTRHTELQSRTPPRVPFWVPDALIYRVGPQSGKATSICLMGTTTEKDPRQGIPISSWKGGATEKDWPKRPSDRQLQEAQKKDSDRNITPAAEAVCVPVHLALPGSPQAKQTHHLHAQLSLGQSCHRQKESLVFIRTGSLRSCPTLPNPVDCGLPGFSVREGGSPDKNTGAYWPILVAIPF